MLIRKISFVGIVIGLLFLASCKQEKDSYPLNFEYAYAPIDTGNFVIYDVDSIFFNYVKPTQFRDTQSYQIMEVIADTFYDAESRLNYRLERFKRKDATQTWDFDRVWYAYKSRLTYERVEDDLRFVKLVFPPTLDANWNGNNYLVANDSSFLKAFSGWNYHYTEINVPKTINGLSFDSTLTVSEVDEENLIDKRLSKSSYAKNVGLIYKEWEILNKQDVGSSWENPEKVTGFRIRMRVNSYRK